VIRITFLSPEGDERHTAEARPGMTLLELAHREGIDIEGACGGNLACSTCHVIVAEADYLRLPDPSEEEEDMLDLVLGVTARSRLGCQIRLTDALDGLTVRLPAQTSDLRG